MHTIEETKKSYDAACKEVLADRYILSNILKECVEEFSGESIDYIATVCIQGSPEIGTIPVNCPLCQGHFERRDLFHLLLFLSWRQWIIPGFQELIIFVWRQLL